MTASEPSLTREERAAIAGKIKSLVLAKHVNVANPSQDYGPWTQEFDRRLDEVVAAPYPSHQHQQWRAKANLSR